MNIFLNGRPFHAKTRELCNKIVNGTIEFAKGLEELYKLEPQTRMETWFTYNEDGTKRPVTTFKIDGWSSLVWDYTKESEVLS